MLKNWRTTLTGILGVIGSTGAYLSFILQNPRPGWVDLFAASGAWCSAMAYGVGQILGADAKAVDVKLDTKVDK